MYTLTQLQVKVKERLRQLVTTTAATAESETGFLHSNLAITDAINSGRHKLHSTIAAAGLYLKQFMTITTVDAQQDYDLDLDINTIDGIIYDYSKDGDPSDSEEMVQLNNITEEMTIIKDTTMYAPSVTEPYYRIVGKVTTGEPQLHIIVSADGAVPAGDEIHVEFFGDLVDLDNTAPTGTSNLSHELDDMVVLWALSLLTETTDQAASNKFKQEYMNESKIMNTNKRGGL